jgi:hypothetical protein
MASLFYTIDLLEIRKYGLNINEYLTLLKFQHDAEGKTFPFVPDGRFYARLLKDNFIREKDVVMSPGMDIEDFYKPSGEYELGVEGLKIFSGEDLFEEFFALFPNSVDTGTGRRAISAKDPNSISGRATHDLWKRTTKNKVDLQRKIIAGLKRELENRKANNSLGFLQGIDTWLRQATWEKWEDVPEKKSSSNNYIKL